MVGFETFLEAPAKETKGVVGYDVPEGVDIRGRYDPDFARILTKDALLFVAGLQREFRSHVKYAMECRKEAKMRYNNGALPGFDPATKYVREGEWVCAAPPRAVADRRVEITGPVERKMIINALNSGANVLWYVRKSVLSCRNSCALIVECEYITYETE
ncbi:UNVERIFIED_CONTAM: Malate synthase, glyoxysomal [Sesamum latifolium]|uniref:Malate synthase, glyoxysomal n=1 Tax=Sesamum latifolium TaxID=2727402 RepID=A0AAW2UEY9_9LAMI